MIEKIKVRKNINWKDTNFQLGGLNWKIALIKGGKILKRMRVKLKKIEQKIWLKDKIERKKASTKLQGIKIEI